MRAMLIRATAVAVLVAGCASDGGDSDVPGAGGRELDRCSLVTLEEAAEWLGDPITAGPGAGSSGASPVSCLYEGANAAVLVQVRDGAAFFAEPGSASRTGEDLAGLGEDAFTDSDGLEFLQNDWSVSVSRIAGLVDDAALEDMAQVISSRLP